MTKMLLALAVASLTALVPQAHAQTFPSQPITMVIGYATGGTADVVARIIGDKLSIALGKPVILTNRPGAAGSIGTRSVVTAPPDGHTILFGFSTEVAILQHLTNDLGYDAATDLIPIALAANVPMAVTVPTKAPYDTMADMMKALPTADISFASTGIGTPSHLAGEVLRIKAKSKFTHVPYKGAAPALNDVIGGHIDLYFPGLPAVLSHLSAPGRLKVLAVSTAKRSGAAPSLPTVAEATGISDYDFSLWAGFFAPKGTPAAIVSRLNAEFRAIVSQPETRQKLLDAGADVDAMSLEQFAAFVKAESAKYGRIIKETNTVVPR